jgi:hypothetical protein
MPQKTKTFKNQQPHTKKNNNKKQEKLDKFRSTLPLKARTTKTTKNVPTRGKSAQQTKQTKCQEQKKDSKISNHTLKNAKKNMI